MDPLVITNILEIKYLPYLGIGLNLEGCCKCGNQNSIVTIDGDAGGYICSNCLRNEKIVDTKVLQMLRMYYYVDIKSISELKISKSVKNEINDFLNTLREYGIDLKSCETIFAGGGSLLFKTILEKSDKVGKSTFLGGLNANAKGYEELYSAMRC